jgi:hypothetical protein
MKPLRSRTKCGFEWLAESGVRKRKTTNNSCAHMERDKELIPLDEVLDMLDRTTRRIQKVLEENKETAAKQTPVYEQVLLSTEASEAQKVKALFGKAFELDRLERLSDQLTMLYMLKIFAFKVKVLEVEVENIGEQLAKSGIHEKRAELEGIKKNIDSLKILLEAQYESLK